MAKKGRIFGGFAGFIRHKDDDFDERISRISSHIDSKGSGAARHSVLLPPVPGQSAKTSGDALSGVLGEMSSLKAEIEELKAAKTAGGSSASGSDVMAKVNALALLTEAIKRKLDMELSGKRVPVAKKEKEKGGDAGEKKVLEKVSLLSGEVRAIKEELDAFRSIGKAGKRGKAAGARGGSAPDERITAISLELGRLKADLNQLKDLNHGSGTPKGGRHEKAADTRVSAIAEEVKSLKAGFKVLEREKKSEDRGLDKYEKGVDGKLSHISEQFGSLKEEFAKIKASGAASEHDALSNKVKTLALLIETVRGRLDKEIIIRNSGKSGAKTGKTDDDISKVCDVVKLLKKDIEKLKSHASSSLSENKIEHLMAFQKKKDDKIADIKSELSSLNSKLKHLEKANDSLSLKIDEKVSGGVSDIASRVSQLADIVSIMQKSGRYSKSDAVRIKDELSKRLDELASGMKTMEDNYRHQDDTIEDIRASLGRDSSRVEGAPASEPEPSRASPESNAEGPVVEPEGAEVGELQSFDDALEQIEKAKASVSGEGDLIEDEMIDEIINHPFSEAAALSDEDYDLRLNKVMRLIDRTDELIDANNIAEAKATYEKLVKAYEAVCKKVLPSEVEHVRPLIEKLYKRLES